MVEFPLCWAEGVIFQEVSPSRGRFLRVLLLLALWLCEDADAEAEERSRHRRSLTVEITENCSFSVVGTYCFWATACWFSVPRNAHADVLVSSVRMICENSYTLCGTKLCVTGELPYKSCLVWDEVKGEQNWRPKLFFFNYSETLNAHGRLWWLIYRLSYWNV